MGRHSSSSSSKKKSRHHRNKEEESRHYERRDNSNGDVMIKIIRRKKKNPNSENIRTPSPTRSSFQDTKSKSRPGSEIRRSNLKLVDTFMKTFASLKFTELPAIIPNDISFEIVDATKKIPYAGLYVGRDALISGLTKFRHFVNPIRFTVEDILINVDCSKIIATMQASQTNKSGNATTTFDAKLFFTFTFDRESYSLREIEVVFDTGKLDLFYNSNPC